MASHGTRRLCRGVVAVALAATVLAVAGCGGTAARETGSGMQELARATGEPEIHVR
jgi:hypothetical protein